MSVFFAQLPPRGLIHIEGADRHSFLQGLITNDIHKTAPGQLLYACLLTPQGKFLHDFFIHDTGEAFLLDCEGGARAQDLYQRLLHYRLRAKVQISVEDSVPVYAVFGNAAVYGLPDPRHDDLGYRSFEKPSDMPEKPLDAPDSWDARRIALTIPDGSRDLTPEKSTMDEAHMDQLGAIDYKKGCYIGQELTARMHYRGLGKRHLRSFNLHDTPLPEGAEQRSTCGDWCMALVRD